MVTVDFLHFERGRDAIRALLTPARLYERRPAFARAFVSGAGKDLHGPWEPLEDLSLRAGLSREDGWGNLALRRLTVIASWAGGEAPAAARGAALLESWRGVFEPLHSHGSLDGADPLAGARGGRPAGSAGAIFTCGSGGRHPIKFLRQNNHVVEELHRAPGLLTAYALFTLARGRTNFSTLSCWSDLDAALAFAYRSSPQHRAAIDTNRSRYRAETYFARLRLVGSEGTLAGRDPFQDVAADTAA